MFTRIIFFLFFCFSLNASAREYASTGFFYPLKNESPGFSSCGRWLERSGSNGCYPTTGVYHTGSDMTASLNTPVYAIADGTVVYKSINGWGSGNVALLIEHKRFNGGNPKTFRAMYGHIIAEKSVGDQVRAGERIGRIGYWSNGNHLHFGILMIGKEFPFDGGYWGMWQNNKFGVIFSSQQPYYDNALIDPIWFITHNAPDNWISRAAENQTTLQTIPPTSAWFPQLCGGYPLDTRCDGSDATAYTECVYEGSTLCSPSIKSYSAINGGGSGSGTSAGGGGGSYNLNQDTDIIDPVTGSELIAGDKPLVSGKIVDIKVELISEGGDVRNFIQSGKEKIETDFYVRIDSGNWKVIQRNSTMTSNLGSSRHTERVSYTIPSGISEISFRVKVDAANAVSESNEGDNWSRIETFQVENFAWLTPIINMILEID